VNTTPSTPTTPTPAPDTTPPGKVRQLRTITKVPGRITLEWSNPLASDLAGIVVRRGWGGVCPTSRREGVRIGGTSVRRSQVDLGAVDGQRYCYAVFAFDRRGNTSQSAVAASVRNPGDQTAPGPVTGLTAVSQNGHVVLSWRNPLHAGVAFDVVRRGTGATNCPTGPLAGTPVGTQSVRTTQVDATAKPGVAYCYRVFALDAAGNSSVANTGADATASKPPAAARHPHPAAPSSSSGSSLVSTLLRVVAAVGLLMLLVMAGATVAARRRMHTSAYVPEREGGMRLALTGVAPVAMVIPALLVLGSCAAIVLVLLNL
jgi:hypothetical protein